MSRTTTAWPDLKRGLVTILRGVKPDEILPIGEALIEAGFEAIEVPLNSPDPFRSIETLAHDAPADVWIGAGTVLDTDQVRRLAEAGGRLSISPNADATVIAAAAAAGLVTMPGVFTASEAFVALKAGASALKFFPASVIGPDGIKAISAVLPPGTVLGAVGGISDRDFASYARAGVRTFGLGSSLYRPGDSAADVAQRAGLAVRAYDEACG